MNRHTKGRLLALTAAFALLAIASAFDFHGATLLGFQILDPHAAMLALGGLAIIGDTVDPELVKKELAKISDQVKEAGEKALAEAKKGIDMASGEKARVDELLVKQGELMATVQELGQKMARRGDGTPQEQKSIGQIVAESDDFKTLFATKSGRARMNVKAIISSASGSTAGGSGAWARPDRVGSPMVMPGLQRLTVRDMMAQGRTSSNLVEYVQESGFTNNAAVAAENTTKPQSDLTFTLVQQPVATIAHYVRATKQILDDAPMLQSYIDTRLRYGLALIEEAQLLNGSGTSGNLNGIYTQATAYSAPITITSATNIDTLRLALLQAELALYPATGIVLHPQDWAGIELTKDSQGRYIFANPQDVATPRLWGRDVSPSMSMTAGHFLVGAFSLASQVFDREDANVLISTEDQDNFIKNLVTIRAEERLASAVYRPAAFIKGALA